MPNGEIEYIIFCRLRDFMKILVCYKEIKCLKEKDGLFHHDSPPSFVNIYFRPNAYYFIRYCSCLVKNEDILPSRLIGQKYLPEPITIPMISTATQGIGSLEVINPMII